MGRYSEMTDTGNIKYLSPDSKVVLDKAIAEFNSRFPLNVPITVDDAYMRARLGELKGLDNNYVSQIRSLSYGYALSNSVFAGLSSFMSPQDLYSSVVGLIDKGVNSYIYQKVTDADKAVLSEYAQRLDRGGNDDDAFIKMTAIEFAAYVGAAAIVGTIAVGAAGVVAAGAAGAAAGSATEAGTLAGSTGLLTEGGGGTLAALNASAVPAATLGVSTTQVVGGSSLVTGLLATAETQGGNLLETAKQNLIDSVVNPPKSTTTQTAPVQTAPAQTESNESILKYLTPISAIFAFLK